MLWLQLPEGPGRPHGGARGRAAPPGKEAWDGSVMGQKGDKHLVTCKKL